MKRKMIWVVLLLAFGGMNLLTAQEVKKNIISAGMANLGGVVGYERTINYGFSIGLDAYNSYTFEIDTYKDTSWFKGVFGAEALGKWYPGQGIFFIKLGMGYSWDWADAYRHGFLVNPGIGLKIDIGRPGGFILTPAIDTPIVIGKEQGLKYGSYIGIGYIGKLSLGYCF
jgi:hypothetical protein